MEDERGRRDFAPGNIDENGNYIVGKYRPPAAGQFRENDGRRRGRRPKGAKNVKTDFREELAERLGITENGKKMRVTKQRQIVKRTCERAMKGNERAAEIALGYAPVEDETVERLTADEARIVEMLTSPRFLSDAAAGREPVDFPLTDPSSSHQPGQEVGDD